MIDLRVFEAGLCRDGWGLPPFSLFLDCTRFRDFPLPGDQIRIQPSLVSELPG
jgi:hypothetical protein